MGRLLLLACGIGVGVAAAIYRSAREMRSTPEVFEDPLAPSTAGAGGATAASATGAPWDGRAS
jgi:hypothetical protein